MSSFQEQHPELVLEILQAGERVCESHVPCETTFHNIRSEMHGERYLLAPRTVSFRAK